MATVTGKSPYSEYLFRRAHEHKFVRFMLTNDMRKKLGDFQIVYEDTHYLNGFAVGIICDNGWSFSAYGESIGSAFEKLYLQVEKWMNIPYNDRKMREIYAKR